MPVAVATETKGVIQHVAFVIILVGLLVEFRSFWIWNGGRTELGLGSWLFLPVLGCLAGLPDWWNRQPPLTVSSALIESQQLAVEISSLSKHSKHWRKP